jgi:uncharacterized membrane protein
VAWCLIITAVATFGTVLAQDVPEDFGYLEGRILEFVAGPDGDMTALVELPDGRILEATLPRDPFADIPMPEYRPGEQVEVYYSPDPAGGTRFVVSDWVRRPALLALTALFLLVSVVVAGYKGLRAFISTGASLAIVIWFIVPQILGGASPAVISLLGVGGILILAIYFVHGLSWSTTAALLGTFVAVLVTMGLGLWFTELAHLTGFGTEEAMLINAAAPQVALRGLLLAGLLIGALGALTDITIVQAAVVRELAHVNPEFGLGELYRRGMNVGLDHIGSLVNTLVLAYTGSALSLLLLLAVNDVPWDRALNLELVAAEIVHILVGSIGLVLAVPITTILAAALFRGDRIPLTAGELDHAHHHH